MEEPKYSNIIIFFFLNVFHGHPTSTGLEPAQPSKYGEISEGSGN